ncbi:MAG TPA: Gfo/Idh/MocA family oxidoreductase [Candidatus Hydrogenedentes bacterium]|nr:Gfo/Idh/MocA family oxidoreductase [Candidatus Hydrogenedentota bacterium]
MSSDVTRRNFIKTTGAAVGIITTAGFNAGSFAANEKIRLGIIGTGKQGQIAHIGQGLTVNKDQIKIVATCDIWSYNREIGANLIDDTDLSVYVDYKEMVDKEELDAVLIATPLYTHYQIVMDCLDAGLYVFCEKTMTMTIEESRNIVEKCNETGKFVQIGHQRHYNPYYNKAIWLANDKNMLGRITHITAQWHRNESWRRQLPKNHVPTAQDMKLIPDMNKHINWRLYNDMSAGLMTELGTHQLDVASWFLGSIPTKVSGFGDIEYWRDDRDAEDHTVLIYEWSVKPGDRGFRTIDRRSRDQKTTRINRPYKVRMTYSSICTNAKSHYGELIQGERGAFGLVGEQSLQFYAEPWYQEFLAAKAARAAGKQVAAKTSNSYIPGAAGNAGIPISVYTDENKSTKYDVWMANHNQWAGFANDVKTNGMPKANQITGLISAICGHKGNEAIRGGGTVEIDPELLAFNFETPDPHRFDEVEGPEPKETMERLRKEELDAARKLIEEAENAEAKA